MSDYDFKDFPVIHLPPCDELAIVVADLYGKARSGALTALPKAWRADLLTLKVLCKEIPPQIEHQLTALLRLPDEPDEPGDQEGE